MKIVENIKSDVSIGKVRRLLGERRGRRSSSRIIKRVEKAVDELSGMVEPKVIYAEKHIDESKNGKVKLEGGVSFNSRKLSMSLGSSERAAVFVATIGEKLEKRMADLMKKRKMTDAYICDAIGSVAVEETLDRFQKEYGNGNGRNGGGEKTTMRFSPGYCDWNIREQKKLFRVVNTRLIDVRLQPSCLMRPSKSVSGIFGVYKGDGAADIIENPCLMCGKKNCPARRN